MFGIGRGTGAANIQQKSHAVHNKHGMLEKPTRQVAVKAHAMHECMHVTASSAGVLLTALRGSRSTQALCPQASGDGAA